MQKYIETPEVAMLSQSVIMALKILIMFEGVATTISLKKLQNDLTNLTTSEQVNSYLESLSTSFKVLTNYYRWRRLILDVINYYKIYPQKLIAGLDNVICFDIALLPKDMWHFIFSMLTKVDLAMLQQSNRFFHDLVTKFIETRSYADLAWDDYNYMLTPRISDISLPQKSDTFSVISNTNLLVEVVLSYDIELGKKPEFYVFNYEKKTSYGHQNRLDVNLEGDCFVGSHAVINKNELLIATSLRAITVWRRNVDDKFEFVQTIRTRFLDNLLKVINDREFVTGTSDGVLNVWGKDHKNNFQNVEVYPFEKISSIFVINHNEFWIYNGFNKKIHVMRRREDEKFHETQKIEVETDLVIFLKINNFEILTISWLPGKIILWHKNEDRKYDVKQKLDSHVFRPHRGIVIRNGKVIFTCDKYFYLISKNANDLLEIKQTGSIRKCIDSITELNNNDILFASSDAKDSFHVWTWGNNGLLYCSHVFGGINESPAVVCPTGEIVANTKYKTLAFFTFPSLNRLMAQFHRPLLSAKDVVEKIGSALADKKFSDIICLFQRYLNEKNTPKQWDANYFSFWCKGNVKEGKDEFMAYTFIYRTFSSIEDAKNEIKNSLPLSDKQQDDIYKHALIMIGLDLQDQQSKERVKDARIRAAIYLWQKLIANFEKNHAFHDQVLNDSSKNFHC